jgi:hypothetical protein
MHYQQIEAELVGQLVGLRLWFCGVNCGRGEGHDGIAVMGLLDVPSQIPSIRLAATGCQRMTLAWGREKMAELSHFLDAYGAVWMAGNSPMVPGDGVEPPTP